MVAKEDVLRVFKDTLWEQLKLKAEELDLDVDEVRRKIYKPIVRVFENLVKRTPEEKPVSYTHLTLPTTERV